MIKRIVFVVALLCIVLGVVYRIDRQSAQNIVRTIKQEEIVSTTGLVLTGGLAQRQGDEVQTDVSQGGTNQDKQQDQDNQDNAESTTNEENNNQETNQESADTIIVSSEEAREVLERELGLENRGGTVVIQSDQDQVSLSEDAKDSSQATKGNTSTDRQGSPAQDSSNTSSSEQVASRLTSQDYALLERMSRNIRSD